MEWNEIIRWCVSVGVRLIVGVVTLLVVYRIARPAIHRIVPSVMHAQAVTLSDGTLPSDEVSKRAATLEDLLNCLLRVALIMSLVALVLAVFDLWSLLAGLVLIVAAITVASQDVVLDYVMGFLILVEGPFFKGDWVVIGDQTPVIEGEVQEIGLRRTVLRDSLGSVHAVSNGLIRLSSNETRVFSVAVVEVQILRPRDLDAAVAAANRICRELQADPDWVGRLRVDAPTDAWITALTLDGATVRIQQRVSPGAQMAVASAIRRRLAGTLADASVGIGRWDTPLPISTQPREGNSPVPSPSRPAPSRRRRPAGEADPPS